MKLALLFLALFTVPAHAEWCPIPGGPCFGPPSQPQPPPPPPPPPPPGYGLCVDSEFNGQYSNGVRAQVSIRSNGYYVDGWERTWRPNGSYSLRGDCRDFGNYADVQYTLNNGSVHRGRIYQASDYRIYFQGQESSGLRFTFQRR